MYVRVERLRFLQESIEKNITENSFSINYKNLKSTLHTTDADDDLKIFNEINKYLKILFLSYEYKKN